MIQALSQSLNQKQIYNIIQNKSSNLSKKQTLETDKVSLSKSNKLSFKGRQFSTGYYYDSEIEQAKKLAKLSYDGIKYYVADDVHWTLWRDISGKYSQDLRDKVSKTQTLIGHVKAEHTENLLKKEKLHFKEMEVEDNITDAEVKLKPNFLVLAEEKKPLPNGIALNGTAIDTKQKIVNMIASKTGMNYAEVTHTPGKSEKTLAAINEKLEAGKQMFLDTGRKTLLYVKNFDALAAKKPENDDVFGVLKNLMGRSAKEHPEEGFATTFIVDIKDKTNIHPEIIRGPHRLKPRLHINVNKSFSESEAKELTDVNREIDKFDKLSNQGKKNWDDHLEWERNYEKNHKDDDDGYTGPFASAEYWG